MQSDNGGHTCARSERALKSISLCDHPAHRNHNHHHPTIIIMSSSSSLCVTREYTYWYVMYMDAESVCKWSRSKHTFDRTQIITQCVNEIDNHHTRRAVHSQPHQHTKQRHADGDAFARTGHMTTRAAHIRYMVALYMWNMFNILIHIDTSARNIAMKHLLNVCCVLVACACVHVLSEGHVVVGRRYRTRHATFSVRFSFGG